MKVCQWCWWQISGMALFCMHECEIAAIHRSFIAAKQISQETQKSAPLCKRVTICVDNLEAKNLVETAIKELHGSLALESLLTNNSRVRLMLHDIRNYIKEYESVELRWIRSHTTSHSFLARGNNALLVKPIYMDQIRLNHFFVGS